MQGVSGTCEVCLSHPSFRQPKTGRDHRRRFNLNVCVGFPGRAWWVSGCGLDWFSRDLLFPPVSVLHLLGVGDRCTGTGAVHSEARSPPASCKSTNVVSWRILLLLHLRSSSPPHVLCFMEMSSRSWGRSHWVPGKEFIS